MAIMSTTVHWFRQDLRLADNPALSDAARGGRVAAVYVLDDINAGPSKPGAASRVWLHHALAALNRSLGGNLHILTGDPAKVLPDFAAKHGAQAVTWNRCYEPWQITRDTALKAALAKAGVDVRSHNGFLLWEPWTITKQDGTAYKVFTPFYRKGCLNAPAPRAPLPNPKLTLIPGSGHPTPDLLPKHPWHMAVSGHWDISESGAKNRLDRFLEHGLPSYKEGRDFPAKPFVSGLSPYLHFGQISPNQIWHAVQLRRADFNSDHFLSELGWREFSYVQLFRAPELPHRNLQPKFDAFPWRDDAPALRAWQRGQTGVPIVDAGMRELWQTGSMHNRVRMIVASFLVKNLLVDWRHGAAWFWQCLVDADLASNSAGWQWVAGCGADAAPYFRIFNPVTQAQKFDPDGAYIRTYVPELTALPNKFVYAPWLAPDSVLQEAGVSLDTTYPKPITDLKTSRQRALEAFATL